MTPGAECSRRGLWPYDSGRYWNVTVAVAAPPEAVCTRKNNGLKLYDSVAPFTIASTCILLFVLSAEAVTVTAVPPVTTAVPPPPPALNTPQVAGLSVALAPEITTDCSWYRVRPGGNRIATLVSVLPVPKATPAARTLNTPVCPVC